MRDEEIATGEKGKRGRGEEETSSPLPLFPSSPFPRRPSSLAAWLERATVACLFLFAVAAPHSIAAAQGAWALGVLLWAARFLFRPRPKTYRTPVDAWLLGFFVLTFLTALTSYDVDVSVGKLRAASLFTIVYLAAE